MRRSLCSCAGLSLFFTACAGADGRRLRLKRQAMVLKNLDIVLIWEKQTIKSSGQGYA